MIWVIKDFEARRLMKNMREIVRLEFENLSKILMNGAAKFKKKSKLTMKNRDIIARYSTSKAITPDLPIEEPDNSLSMGDEHLDITSSNENLVPIPSEFEGMSDNTSDNDRLNIDPILEEFAGELAHIAPIPPGIVEADFHQMMILRVIDDSFRRHRIEPDQEGLISIDNSNNTLLELLEFESFHFDPSFPRPPLEPPDVEICLHFEPDAPAIDNFNELNEDQRGSEIIFLQNVEDDVFTFCHSNFFPVSTIPLWLHLYLAPRASEELHF
ncbi:hypothetical protein Tco_0138903 [Tanacetum coccineum]